MASNSRQQIETWLSTLAIKGSVIDIGGLFWPAKGRTKTWDVDKYCILDISAGRKGIKTNCIWDMNYPLKMYDEYDNAFCIEVTDHLWNPVVAFQNMNLLLKKGGILYLSSNFLFPHHTGFDCIRFTSAGLSKILKETGFEVISMKSRFAVDASLENALALESKIQYHKGEIGYMAIAQKL